MKDDHYLIPIQKLLPLGNQAAREARDEAFDTVLGNENEIWKARATALVAKQMLIAEPFTGETLRLACYVRIGRPHHHNVWGAMMNAWLRAGLILQTDQLTHMRTTKSHGRSTPLYLWPARGIISEL